MANLVALGFVKPPNNYMISCSLVIGAGAVSHKDTIKLLRNRLCKCVTCFGLWLGGVSTDVLQKQGALF